MDLLSEEDQKVIIDELFKLEFMDKKQWDIWET